jgi:hypothetical protein
MTFEEWHKNLCCPGCAETCPHKEWERLAWNAAVESQRERCSECGRSDMHKLDCSRNYERRAGNTGVRPNCF